MQTVIQKKASIVRLVADKIGQPQGKKKKKQKHY